MFTIITSKKFLGLLLFSIAMTFIISCSSDDDSGPTINPDPDMMDPCEGVTSLFGADVKSIIDAACAISGCHVPGGLGNGNFEEYEGIKDKADSGSLIARVITIGDMPPSNSTGPTLTQDQRNLIRCWVEDGANNN